MLNLEPIKARLAAATPGNWCWDYDQAERAVVDPGWLIYSKNAPKQTLLGKINNYEDMELVVNAPDDLAALFVEVERLRSEMGKVERLRALIANHRDYCECDELNSRGYAYAASKCKACAALYREVENVES